MVSLPMLRERLYALLQEMDAALKSGNEHRHAQLNAKYEESKELLERAERLTARAIDLLGSPERRDADSWQLWLTMKRPVRFAARAVCRVATRATGDGGRWFRGICGFPAATRRRSQRVMATPIGAAVTSTRSRRSRRARRCP